MLIKLGIIAGVIILGGMVFSNEIDTFFPETSTTVADSLRVDVADIGSKASETVEKRLDESVDQIQATTGSIKGQIDEAGEKITAEIGEVRDSSEKMISEEVSGFDPLRSIRDMLGI